MKKTLTKIAKLAPGDKALILVLLGFALLALLWTGRPLPNRSAEVVVTVAGREVARRPAAQDGAFVVRLPKGSPSGFMRLTISGGRVRVSDEVPLCPRRICLKTGWISRPNQAIVCVPNRVVIRFEGTRDEPPYDALAQ